MDRDACHAYDQFSKHVEHIIIDDCIDDYMFLNDHYQCDLKPFVPLSCDHHAGNEETAIVDDQELISKEKEGYLFASREAFMDEQLFSVDQHASDIGFKDPFAALLESYVSNFLKISNFIISLIPMGEYGFLKELMSLLLYLCYYSLISDIDEIILVIKLLEWLLWKSVFT
jgi:hypothetical protein